MFKCLHFNVKLAVQLYLTFSEVLNMHKHIPRKFSFFEDIIVIFV